MTARDKVIAVVAMYAKKKPLAALDVAATLEVTPEMVRAALKTMEEAGLVEFHSFEERIKAGNRAARYVWKG